MSKYLTERLGTLEAYVPGEQPQDKKYVKLNTNECPFPPSPFASRLARQAAAGLNLYCDPECRTLTEVAADAFGVRADQMIFTNGSDEVLDFAFIAFCGEGAPAVFPDITYGFYPVFAKKDGVPYREIPLTADYRVRVSDYIGAKGTIFLANPNAPTGVALTRTEIEEIVKGNPDNVVVVDEAYVDFGGESALPLIDRYDNLLVTRTFSKSYSFAGGRLGIGFACPALISDLKKVKYSTNPYNVNSMTAAAGVGALLDKEYFESNIAAIRGNRASLTASLEALGFDVLPSSANFVFAKCSDISGEILYKKLKEKGVLVRYFDKERIRAFVRITVGTAEEIEALISAINEIKEGK
ncbi:MAG: histidinol-phosphate transaminase [Clostridia bacterium]|nr:histidinol-phosphate transaminase [Clostridia bacterium]